MSTLFLWLSSRTALSSVKRGYSIKQLDSSPCLQAVPCISMGPTCDVTTLSELLPHEWAFILPVCVVHTGQRGFFFLVYLSLFPLRSCQRWYEIPSSFLMRRRPGLMESTGRTLVGWIRIDPVIVRRSKHTRAACPEPVRHLFTILKRPARAM